MARSTKKDIISKVKTDVGLSQTQAQNAVNATFDYIMDQVAAGNDVAVTDFGTFTSAMSPARDGRNPSTGEKIRVEAKKRPKFHAGKGFKDKVSG